MVLVDKVDDHKSVCVQTTAIAEIRKVTGGAGEVTIALRPYLLEMRAQSWRYGPRGWTL